LSGYAYTYIHDSDDNQVPDKQETIYYKDVVPNKPSTIKASLPKGAYYIRVTQYDKIRNSKYNLKFNVKNINSLDNDPGNSMNNNVYDIGEINKRWNVQDIVGMTDKDDFYRFDLSKPKNVSITVSDTVEWLKAYLIHDKNANGELGRDEIIKSIDVNPKKAGDIKATLSIGRYFIRVSPYDKIRNSKYTLKLFAK